MTTTRVHRPALLVGVAALALGVAGRLALRSGVDVPHGAALGAVAGLVLALGAPWLAVAFAVGTRCGSHRAGALAGGTVLVLGTCAWYALTVARGGRAAVFYAFPVAPAWAIAGLVAGAAFGLAGAGWRLGGPAARTAAAAVLAGAFAGEALLLAGEWSGRAAHGVLAIEIVAAAVVLARHPTALPLAPVATVAMAMTEGAVRDALRLTGWAGA